MLLALLVASVALAQPEATLRQHKVSNRQSPAPEPGAENFDIPSLVTPKWDREAVRKHWTAILGKFEPNKDDRKWFGDIRKAAVKEKREEPTYTRILLDLPMEKDFLQPHVLLIPNGVTGKRPAVICWTSSTPDYTAPEQWWGKWLVERGYVVLTGWSFIRNYRDGTTARKGAPDKLRERFGHWLPMARMVYDVRREAEYLRSLPYVDGKRIGFMGFSLSAKTAVYVGAFAKEIAATVAVDPHNAVNGGTNYFEPWYLDWMRPYPDIPTKEHTVLSMLNTDPSRPGFEHDHHELLALTAPRPFLLIGGRGDLESTGGDSDDRQSWGYYNRAKEVYRLLAVPERLEFVLTSDGHSATGPNIDRAWQTFIQKWLGGK